MLEFVEALSDVNIGGEGNLQLQDEFIVVGLYAGVCIFLDLVSVSASVCVRFALTDPVMCENV